MMQMSPTPLRHQERRLPGVSRRVIATAGVVGIALAGAIAGAQSAHAAASSDRVLTIDAPAQVFVGVPAQFTATLTNNGPDAFDPSIAINDLVFGLAAPSATQLQVTDVDNPDCTLNGQTTVACEFGTTLDAGESFSVTLTAVAGGTGSVVPNGTIGLTGDPDISNNSASAGVIPVIEGADLAVDLAASSGLLSSQIRYNLTVDNDGPADATGVQVAVDLPNQTSSVTGLPAACTYNASSDEVTCNYNLIGAGGNRAPSFTATMGLLSIGQLPATATRIASNPTDPNPTNDTNTANCTVLTSLIIACS